MKKADRQLLHANVVEIHFTFKDKLIVCLFDDCERLKEENRQPK